MAMCQFKFTATSNFCSVEGQRPAPAPQRQRQRQELSSSVSVHQQAEVSEMRFDFQNVTNEFFEMLMMQQYLPFWSLSLNAMSCMHLICDDHALFKSAAACLASTFK